MVNILNESPWIITIVVFIILGILFILFGIVGDILRKKKNILIIPEKRSATDKDLLDRILDRIDFVVKREEEIDKKIAILDANDARTLTKFELLGMFIGILISIYLRNVLVVVPLTILCTNIPFACIEARINRKLKQLNDQVLEAFQLFITEYTTTRSVQKTITEICPKLKYPLRKEFELLARKLNSGVSIEEAFLSFAERTQNKWIMVFSQLMITYFRNGGDFIPHLLNITEYITSEKILAEQNITELSSLRWLNIGMNILVPIAYISNMFINPENARVFIETPQGRILMFFIVMSSMLSLYLGKKITRA